MRKTSGRKKEASFAIHVRLFARPGGRSRLTRRISL